MVEKFRVKKFSPSPVNRGIYVALVFIPRWHRACG